MARAETQGYTHGLVDIAAQGKGLTALRQHSRANGQGTSG